MKPTQQHAESVWLGIDADGRPTGSVYEYDPSGIREGGTVEHVPASRVTALELELERAKEGLEAAELAMNHALELGHCGEGSTRGMVTDALKAVRAALRDLGEGQ